MIDKFFGKTSPGEEKATKDDAAADGAKLPDDGKVEEGEGVMYEGSQCSSVSNILLSVTTARCSLLPISSAIT